MPVEKLTESSSQKYGLSTMLELEAIAEEDGVSVAEWIRASTKENLDKRVGSANRITLKLQNNPDYLGFMDFEETQEKKAMYSLSKTKLDRPFKASPLKMVVNN